MFKKAFLAVAMLLGAFHLAPTAASAAPGLIAAPAIAQEAPATIEKAQYGYGYGHRRGYGRAYGIRRGWAHRHGYGMHRGWGHRRGYGIHRGYGVYRHGRFPY